MFHIKRLSIVICSCATQSSAARRCLPNSPSAVAMPLAPLRLPLARALGSRVPAAFVRQSAPLSIKASNVARAADEGFSPGFYVIGPEPHDVIEYEADGKTPLVVKPRVELTLEWLVESPPPEHTWEEPPIFYDVVEETPNK